MIATTAHQIASNNAIVARAAGMTLLADGMVAVRAVRGPMAFALILLGTLVALTLAKAALLALIGPEAYGASLVVMQDGGLVDRAGAAFLAVDGATRVLAELML